MLAELTLLLHEMTDSSRSRVPSEPIPSEHALSGASGGTAVVVTGLASAGKARLVAALQQRLSLAQIPVRSTSDHPDPESSLLHVHAETDLEALVEGALQSAPQKAGLGANAIVQVDWEPVERSVTRIVELLEARAAVDAELGT